MSQESPIRILIADDHDLIREGLKRILLARGFARRIGEASNAAEAIALAQAEPWDVVVLDINLPGRSGLDALKEIKAGRPSLPVLVLSMYPEEQFGLRVIRAGADGYVTKAMAPDVIVDAISSLVGGEKYITPGIAVKLADAVVAPRGGDPHEALSDREDQVFRRIAAGVTVGEIASELHLSVKTVSTYRANVLRKLGLANNAQVMRYAHDNGLVD